MNKKRIGILVDSGTVLEQEFIDQNHIEIIPLSLSDNHEKVYSDEPSIINPNILFDEIAKGNTFKTSATAIGLIMNKVEAVLQEYEKLIFIPISSGISSQYQNIKMLAENEYPNQLFVVNALSAGIANYYVCQEIVK